VSSGHFDDNSERVEEEVDSSKGPATSSMDHLHRRARQPCPTKELEEPALQHRVSTGVDKEPIKGDCTPPTGPAQLAESGHQDH
jgi:hypothetical protein